MDEQNSTSRRLGVYLETLRVRMEPAQFGLLMRILRGWVQSGGGTVQLQLAPGEQELFTPEVRGELLVIMGMFSRSSSLEPETDRVVVNLGDGHWIKEAQMLLPVEVAEDPERLAKIREDLDSQAEQRERDKLEVEAIARISGIESDGTTETD